MKKRDSIALDWQTNMEIPNKVYLVQLGKEEAPTQSVLRVCSSEEGAEQARKEEVARYENATPSVRAWYDANIVIVPRKLEL